MAQQDKINTIEQEETELAQTSKGIPSVAGKRKNKSKKGAVIGVCLALFLLACIGVGFYQKFAPKSVETKEKEPIHYNSAKSLILPSLESITPPEPKVEPQVKSIEVKEEKSPTVAPLPAPATVTVFSEPPRIESTGPQGFGAPAKEQKKEPTLAEKRNMAPMMGESSGASGQGSGGGKGLASTLREEEQEGYVSSGAGGKLGSLMHGMATPSTRAVMMPDRNLLLAKGTFIDCILETKLDTTVPGMTSCVIPQDVYSANGKVLLIEKGSKAIGEYKGAVENGLNRIFVLWTQVQTPKGVRVMLDSPGTDSLGGSGLPGHIDFHWWARFGNALLFTLVQDGFEFAMTKPTENSGGVNYYQNSQDGMEKIIEEAMRQSGNIPPTLTKNQGERIGIFVARDVDFSGVYQLNPIKR